MSQETLFQWPAFVDLLKNSSDAWGSIVPPEVSLKSSDDRNFPKEGRIPLGWFKTPEFRTLVEQQFGNIPSDKPIQLVFNVEPLVRFIRFEKDGKVIEERESKPEIPIWTSLGGWYTARHEETFNGPSWNTKFIQL